MNFFDAAAALVSVGFKVFPLVPGAKLPLVKAWQKVATDDADLIGEWVNRWPNANIGVVTGAPSGVVVIDLDVKDDRNGLQDLAVLARTGKVLPPSPIALTPSGGRHLYFRAALGVKNIVGLSASGRGLAKGIDVRGADGYVVAPPSELIECEDHGAGKYQWLVPPMTSDFPRLPEWALKMLLPPPPRHPHGAKKFQPRDVDEERLRSAVLAIPPEDRDIWRDVGMALKDHLGEAGRKLWDDWSRSCPEKFDERDQEKQWVSFKREGITVATIFHYAVKSGWRFKAAQKDGDTP
jgi:hypothetical protein